MTPDETSLAKLRILVAVARADGRLDVAEEKVLLDRVGLDGASLLHEVLDKADVDFDAAVATLDAADRRDVYHAAYAMTHADGHASVEEVALLRRILPDEGEASLAAQMLGEAADTLMPGRIMPIADPVARDSEVTEDILKYSTLAAVAGATPVPGVGIIADIGVVALQTKMVHDIGRYHGAHTTREAVRDFMVGVLGSTALRIAVNQVARFIPIAGSIVGASTSFASTFALGRVAHRWFEGGQSLSEDERIELFTAARTEGRARFTERQSEVKAATDTLEPKLVQLAAELQEGRLTRAQYDTAVRQLSEA